MFTWILAGANVTIPSPGFHNPGHVRLWNETPLRNFDPHLVTALLILIVVAGVWYFIHFTIKERKKEAAAASDADEKKFQELAAKKNILLNKILQAEEEYNAGLITEVELEERVSGYKSYLYKVKTELNQYLD